MFFHGIIIGFASFILIGIFHPIVAKMEYYFGKQSWPWLGIPGIILLILSLFCSQIISIFLGVLAFSLFWSCIELFKQHTRVMQGRAKKNPLRNYD
jgi:uncharacterized membrane protein